MGTGSSFLRHNDEDDGLGTKSGQGDGVLKRIPIEVKPRGKLSNLRTVRSLGRSKGGSSRSALSIDLENPDVERIRKEFNMYRCNKENELTSLQKKVDKLEMENKKLRAELSTSQKICKKLRDEKEVASEAEHQALTRAAAFEGDRDKVQRQFKLFRETTEGELQRLLQAKRDLEKKVSHLNHGTFEDVESASRFEVAAESGNPGDWWTVLDSEPSLGSTTHLHSSALPDFTSNMMEIGEPYVNVNKDDWTLASATLAQAYPINQEPKQPNLIRIYVSGASDVQTEIDLLYSDFGPRLNKMCMIEGAFLLFVHMPPDAAEHQQSNWEERNKQARCQQIEQSTVFLGFLNNEMHRYTEVEFTLGHLKNPGGRPALFCFKHNLQQSKEIEELRTKVNNTSGAKIIDDARDCREAVEQVYMELEKALKIELGLDQKVPPEEDLENEGLESLCGGSLWDSNQDYQQLQAWNFTKRSTCELGFEKYYETLNAHVCAPGPLPPILVCGPPGCGKSLLLAKWMELQKQKAGCGLVLYHFVGSACSCEADPVIMIRRLTLQLMQHVTSPPVLTCDPIRLLEEFPKWLDKVSSKIPGGVILVLDSADRLQNVEAQLQWLLDPLPVECRVVISVQDNNCPKSWGAWPCVQIANLTNKQVKELLCAELSSQGKTISTEQEGEILAHCRSPSTCIPLYVVLLASELSRCTAGDNVNKRLDSLLGTDVVQMYKVILDLIRYDFETPDTRGIYRKILRYIYAARNGIAESELFQLLPGLTWNVWAPLCSAFIDRHILTFRAGLLIFAHQQIRHAVEEKYVSDSEGKAVTMARQSLRDYFSQFTRPGSVTYRVADELPWLNRQLAQKEQLHENILNLCILVKLYCRGRCSELISYWQYIGVDKHAMAHAYFGIVKQMEEMVGQFDGLITLPRVADVCEVLGRFLKDLGLLSEASTALQRALEIRETVLDPDHPSVAHTLHQVAGLHAQWGKISTAELLYKQALEIYEGAFGRNHYLVARELDALAVLYQKQGKHELADPLHKRALSIRKKCKVPRSSLGETRLIDPLRRRALQLEELAMGPDSPELARSLNEMAVLYYLQNNVKTAESFFRRSLNMRETLLGPEHPDLAQSFNNLAALYNDTKQYEKAQPLYESALAIRKQHCSVDHPSVQSIVKHLGILYKKMGKLEKSEPLYEDTVSIREKTFGSNHPYVATALVNLAVIYSQQGKHSEAEPLYERALKIYEDNFGPADSRVAETLKNMALLKYDQGDFEKAASLYKRCTDIKEADPTAYSSKTASLRSRSSTDTTTTVRTHQRLLNVQPTVSNY